MPYIPDFPPVTRPLGGLSIDMPVYQDLIAQRRRARQIDLGLQIGVAVIGIAAAAMIATTGPLHRWGFVLGLAGQPLWFIATWRTRQWGFLILAIFYTGTWVQGIVNRFF